LVSALSGPRRRVSIGQVTAPWIRANVAAMVFDYKHDFSVEDARARLQVLGEYLKNRHGIVVTWSGDKASFRGKYMVVSIEGEMALSPGVVHVEARDPGMLWRAKAKSYLQDTYLDPATPVNELPRSR
jgi:hypothetical protein